MAVGVLVETLVVRDVVGLSMDEPRDTRVSRYSGRWVGGEWGAYEGDEGCMADGL